MASLMFLVHPIRSLTPNPLLIITTRLSSSRQYSIHFHVNHYQKTLENNPLLQNFVFSPFHVIDASHVRPGMHALLHTLDGELTELEKTAEPTWSKLTEPLERIVDRLSVVWGAVNHLKAVKDTPELRSAIEEIQPEQITFGLKLDQSKPIYNAFKAIRESKDWETLSDARKRIVESSIQDAILSGIALEDNDREEFNKIQREELQPYFSLPKVIDGLFNLVKMLFDIDVVPADGLAPVWNTDVKFYCIKVSSGAPISYFYFDPYSHPSEKRGGAWMGEVVARSRVSSHDKTSVRIPVAHMVCNQMPPVGDKPSLMTFREVETVFHEFGHALHHMLTKQDEGLVAGIRGIEWDAVELPSQFMEVFHRDTLLSITKHYETGESPEDIYQKLLAARTFRAGTVTLRQLKFSALDLNMFPVDLNPSMILTKGSVKKLKFSALDLNMFLCGFSHIFAGGYVAGYYNYKWAEVLFADAFSAFEDAGLHDDKLKEQKVGILAGPVTCSSTVPCNDNIGHVIVKCG